MSTLIFCAAIDESGHDARRVRKSRLALRFSPKVVHPSGGKKVDESEPQYNSAVASEVNAKVEERFSRKIPDYCFTT